MQIRAVLGITCAAFIITGCEEGVYDGFDRRPDVSNATGSSPSADSRGVIVYDTYQVIEARAGDTMDMVAGRIGMTGADLANYNGVAPDYRPRDKEIFAIPAGIVTASDGSIQTTELDDGETPFGEPTNGANAIRHTVQQGETAYTIARSYNVSVTSLASWNNLDRDLTVRVGQQLLIPQSVASTTTPTPVAAAPSNTQTTTTTTTQATPAPAPAPAPQSSARMVMPVQGKIIRDFEDKPGGHDGIDIQADAGSAVVAADAGEVTRVEDSVIEGTKIVIVRHSDNILTVYVNIAGAQVNKGDQVRRGETIGSVAPGSPPYLGFRIYKGTQVQDPEPYLN